MLLGWIIIGVIIVLALVLAKIRHIKHKTFLILILILLAFFYISASQVIGDQDINFSSFEGLTYAGKLYFTWLVHIGGNVKTLAGNAIKMDWAGNITNSAG